ncbi:hypothetical protein [Chitinophaga ginsengisoli]|uniref:Uncharacterized protein n=1 Tax=Chitinophaga ginsengisoli TaxID=363837 RepID=A0A2P8FCY4_9BACT|nr:hypothetical protein [Chitinophaga ginsengisoli]PSL19562.1 hypothetical protein CLV42_12727 [Chitinophaga ginsengisoli]
MKHILILFLLFTTLRTYAQTPDSIWLKQLRTLRDAIYQRDKETVKQFFDFPFSVSNVWYLAQENNDANDSLTQKAINQLASNATPLTEKLFMLYFDQIFHKKFVTVFLKIKTKEVFEKKFVESPEYQGSNKWYYKCTISFRRAEQRMWISYESNNIANGEEPKYDKDGELLETPLGGSESLEFKMIDGQMKLVSISNAG